MKSKLNIDPKVVDSARQHAANIAHDMQDFIDRHTTVSTERTIVRLLGIDGVDELETPLPNVTISRTRALCRQARRIGLGTPSFRPAKIRRRLRRKSLPASWS